MQSESNLPPDPNAVPIFHAASYGDVPDTYFSAETQPGIYLHWDRRYGTPTAFYQIQRAKQFDGKYEPIATVVYPGNDYIDPTGNPQFFYRIAELDQNSNILGFGQPMVGEDLLIKASLAYQIKDFLRVPVYDEDAIFNRDRSQGRFAFTNWNTWPQPEIRISGASNDGDRDPFAILDQNTPIFTTSNGSDNYTSGLKYRLDYNGRAFFMDQTDAIATIHSYDFVSASYYVRLFTNQEMNDALYQALQTINSQPGSNKYHTVASTPFEYDAALICGATYFLLRGLLVGLNQREKRLLLQDPSSSGDTPFDTIGSLRETAKMYQDDWKELLKALPKMRYPRTLSVVSPEFYMPGGRSRAFRQAWGKF